MKVNFFFLILVTFVTPLFSQLGLKAEYYNGKNFNELKSTRIVSDINFDWNDSAPAKGIDLYEFSALFTGQLKPPVSGEYVFFIRVDDGARLWVGSNLLIDAWDLHDSETFMGKIYLDQNTTYDLKVAYFNALLEGEIHLTWQLPTDKPLFRGFMGYNEKKIDPKYFKTKPPIVVDAPVPKPAEPIEKPKLVSTSKVKAKPTPTAPTPVVLEKPAPLPTVTKEIIEKYIPKNILFVKSKSIMESGSFTELDQLAEMLQRYPALKVTIEGHTDNIGNVEKNLKLSEERAKVVADYLVSKGIDDSRVKSIGYGSTRPIHKSGENAKNRRVEFIVD
jgi:outer membrane protein OmpA-like peptidoglycan-associated protein